MKIVVTGGAGFIASHFVSHILQNTDWDIVVLDKFTYASNGLKRLKEVKAYDNPRVQIHVVDVARPLGKLLEDEIGPVDYIAHLAASTHVDRSIVFPRDFVEANIFGTLEMLEYARRIPGLKKFLYFSTDEVFGPAPEGTTYGEWDRYNSTNPYSATKAGGEEMCLAWANTYKVPLMISHCMNVFGEMQHSEKFIPKIVKSILQGDEMIIHGDANGKSGTRFYIHARNVASAAMFMLQNTDELRAKYNITGELEVSNLDLAKRIEGIMGGKLNYKLVDFHSSRPGHDLRYAIDGSKLTNLGWTTPKTFDESLERTIRWMIRPENLHWLNLENK